MDFLKKKIIRLFFIGIIILFFNFSNIEASGWVHDTLPYRIGIQITKPTNTTSLNYAGIPIEKIINFQDYNFTNIDSSSLRITRDDGITKLPLQTEEWSNTNDTCLLIFQIHTADLNDATNTTVTYYLYFDLLSSGIKGQESYTTDLSITSAIRSDTLQNTFVRIIVLDTAVASTIIERTKSSPNLTQGGTGSNIWRNEGMYEIQEGSWWGLQHDTQWFRAHRTGPVKLTLIGTDIDFNNAVSPRRV